MNHYCILLVFTSCETTAAAAAAAAASLNPCSPFLERFALLQKPVVKSCFFIQGLKGFWRWVSLSKKGEHGFKEAVISQDVNTSHSGF